MLNVEDLTTDCLDDCADLFVQSFSGFPWNENWSTDSALRRIDESVQTPGAFGLVVRSDVQVVGFCLGYCETWHSGTDFYLKELCVLPQGQRQGIGKTLMTALLVRLEMMRVRSVYLLTKPDSPWEAFFANQGFRRNQRIVVLCRQVAAPTDGAPC